MMINVNPSLIDEGCIWLGAVIRDHKGGALLIAIKRIHASWSPRVAEGRAIGYRLHLARRLDYGIVV